MSHIYKVYLEDSEEVVLTELAKRLVVKGLRLDPKDNTGHKTVEIAKAMLEQLNDATEDYIKFDRKTIKLAIEKLSALCHILKITYEEYGKRAPESFTEKTKEEYLNSVVSKQKAYYNLISKLKGAL